MALRATAGIIVALAGMPAPVAARPAAPAMLPDRTLDCTLRRIANFDPSREQKPSEYVLEGAHRVRLFLPSIPVRTAPPPESTEPAEPVDPRTRVLLDPDAVTGDVARAFDRVVDDWPRRVEMTRPVTDVAVNLVILDQIDAARGTANMFVTVANDAVTYDQQKLFVGPCRVGARTPAI